MAGDEAVDWRAVDWKAAEPSVRSVHNLSYSNSPFSMVAFESYTLTIPRTNAIVMGVVVGRLAEEQVVAQTRRFSLESARSISGQVQRT